MKLTTSWTGTLTCVGLSIPVKLVTTSSEARHKLEIHEYCLDCNGPIGRKSYCKQENKDVPKDRVYTGFPIAKDSKPIPVTRDELKAVKLKTTKEFQIMYFVENAKIDEGEVRENYFIVPDAKVSVKSYILLTQAMALAGRAAVAKVVIRDRERYFGIKPYQQGLIAQELLFEEELNPIKDYKEMDAVVKGANQTGAREIELAVSLIGKLSKPGLDRKDFIDHYIDAARELIELRAQGKAPAPVEEVKAKVEEKNLIDQLQNSLNALSAGGA